MPSTMIYMTVSRIPVPRQILPPVPFFFARLRFSSIPKKPVRWHSKLPTISTRTFSSSIAFVEEDVVGTTSTEVTRTGVRAFLEGENESSSDCGSHATELTRSAVHRMPVAALRLELALRNMNVSGTRQELVPRLLSVLPVARRRSRSAIIAPSSVESPIVATPTVSGIGVDIPAPINKSFPRSELIIDPERPYVLQVKGRSRNAVGTGLGMVLFDPSNESVRWEARQHLNGSRPALEAEYCAIVVALQHVVKHGVRRLVLETDSEFIHNHLLRTFPVKRDSWRALHSAIVNLKETALQEFSVHLVSPHDNNRAYELANNALATGKSSNISGAVDPVPPVPCNATAGNDFSKLALDGVTPTKRNLMETIDPHATYRLQFDGGARGNPKGIAGAGMVLYDANGQEVWAGWKFLDTMSNNAAEYCALLLGLRCARSLGVRFLIAEGDSELIIKHVSGEYQVRNDQLRPLWEATKDELSGFENIRLQHVFRRHNKRADWLANHAMDTKSSHGFAEMDAVVSTDS